MTTMTIPEPVTRRYKVNDQYQVLEFEGVKIGEASTEVEDQPRWTEITIYRTVGGSYIVHRVGVSLVYHRSGPQSCSSGVGKSVRELLADNDRDYEPCDKCQPGDLDDLDRGSRVRVETDRHSAEAVGIDKLVGALTLRRQNGSEYVSNVAQNALTEAIHNDPELAEALAAKTYIP